VFQGENKPPPDVLSHFVVLTRAATANPPTDDDNVRNNVEIF
jgi:hypothetical protein